MIEMTTSSLMMQAIATSLLAKISTSLDDRHGNFKFITKSSKMAYETSSFAQHYEPLDNGRGILM